MIEQKAADVSFDTEDAIINDEFPGFKEDYLVLHSLIRRYKPKTLFEIGSNLGRGTNIICNAMNYVPDEKGLKTKYKVYSLDLPTELAHISLQHPINEGHGDKVGSLCTFPYTQLRGDSLTFDYSKYPVEGWFIDGEHDKEHVYYETHQAITMPTTKIIIYHDADIPEVWDGIVSCLKQYDQDKWELYRVTDTRIAYALRK